MYLFVCLAVPGLSCGMGVFHPHWGMQVLQLWHVGPRSLTRYQTQAPCIGGRES